MKKIKALTFKEKQETLETIFKQYHRAKIKLHCLENKSFYPKIDYSLVKDSSRQYQNTVYKLDQYIDKKDDLEKQIRAFELIIDNLSSDSRKIIIHEFVKQSRANWWIEYYSRSTYYRMKTRAMEEMLFYLNL